MNFTESIVREDFEGGNGKNVLNDNFRNINLKIKNKNNINQLYLSVRKQPNPENYKEN